MPSFEPTNELDNIAKILHLKPEVYRVFEALVRYNLQESFRKRGEMEALHQVDTSYKLNE